MIKLRDESVFQPIHEHLGYHYGQYRLQNISSTNDTGCQEIRATNICDDPEYIASTEPPKTLGEEDATCEVKFRSTEFD